MPTNRVWTLARRPSGKLTRDVFAFAEQPARDPGEGEVRVRNLMLSVDPTQRGWIAYDTYLPAVKIGEVVRSLGAGRVEASRHPGFKEGDLVSGLVGWQDYLVAKPEQASLGKIPAGTRLELALGALGMTGMTAYFGLLDIGKPKAGETVLISGAAGATGSVAGAIARLHGCRAIGIAGGPEKCKWVVETAGFDACIDYKSESVGQRLGELCPKGVNVYFDNVGGAILDAALAKLARRGRVVLCGGISNYDTAKPEPVRNLASLIVNRGRAEGFIILDYSARFGEAFAALAKWHAEGKLPNAVDLQRGLENAPETLARLFEGKNLGKQLLQIAES